jgi:plasmid stabilization system protein ParE
MTSSGAVWSDFAPEAEAELDGIWIRIARESGYVDIANRVVESIAERLWLLARYPLIGRQEMQSGMIEVHVLP